VDEGKSKPVVDEGKSKPVVDEGNPNRWWVKFKN
jgi:hypothetical protein